MVDFRQMIESLAASRPLFTSERDLQFELGWHLKQRGCELHLEFDPQCLKRNAAVDILVKRPQRVAVELKYITATFTHDEIALRSHPADVARYGVVVDISRLEQVVDLGLAERGVSILLTNNRVLWQPRADAGCNCDAFAIHEGRCLEGAMSWASSACADTFRRYPVPIVLRSAYRCQWFDYADFGGRNGRFRCLITEVTPIAASQPTAAAPHV